MRVKVSLYIAGKVHDEVVSAISYEEAKRTALARNPSGRVIKVSSVIWLLILDFSVLNRRLKTLSLPISIMQIKNEFKTRKNLWSY